MATLTELTLSPETLTFDTDTSAEQQITVTTNATDFTVESKSTELTVTKETNLIKVSPVKGKVGTFNITVKAQAEQESDPDVPAEVSKIIKVKITKLTQETPSAPQIVISSPKINADRLVEDGAKNNINSVTVEFDNDVITVSGNLNDLQEYPSSNPAQGTHKWVPLEIATGLSSIVGVKFDGTDLTEQDKQEASSIGLPEGSFVLWIKAAEGYDRDITLEKDGVTKTVKIKFIDTSKVVPVELPYENLFIQIDKNEISGKETDKFKIEVTTNASDYTVESDDDTVATFDKLTKEVTLLKTGVAYLNFKVAENGLARHVPLCCICTGSKPIITVLFNGVEHKFDNEEEMNRFFEDIRNSSI